VLDLRQVVHEQGSEEYRQDAKQANILIEAAKEREAVQDKSEQFPSHKS